ncbi:MAG: hypothetical protein ACI857_002199 [Arenicella sp.]
MALTTIGMTAVPSDDICNNVVKRGISKRPRIRY